MEQERKDAEEAKKQIKTQSANGLLGLFKAVGANSDNEEGSLEFSFAGLFKIMCCTHQKSIDEKQQLLRIAESLDKLNKRLDLIERAVDPHGMLGSRRRSASRASVRGGGNAGGDGGLASVHENEEDVFNDDSDEESETVGECPHAIIFVNKLKCLDDLNDT